MAKAKAKAGTVNVTIRVHKAYAQRLDEIVRALEASGLSAVECHERFLIVNGSISARRLEALSKVEGVASVRQDRTYGPKAPGSPGAH